MIPPFRRSQPILHTPSPNSFPHHQNHNSPTGLLCCFIFHPTYFTLVCSPAPGKLKPPSFRRMCIDVCCIKYRHRHYTELISMIVSIAESILLKSIFWHLKSNPFPQTSCESEEREPKNQTTTHTDAKIWSLPYLTRNVFKRWCPMLSKALSCFKTCALASCASDRATKATLWPSRNFSSSKATWWSNQGTKYQIVFRLKSAPNSL